MNTTSIDARSPNTAVTYAGLHLKHPVIAAAAGITATVDRMRRAEIGRAHV